MRTWPHYSYSSHKICVTQVKLILIFLIRKSNYVGTSVYVNDNLNNKPTCLFQDTVFKKLSAW